MSLNISSSSNSNAFSLLGQFGDLFFFFLVVKSSLPRVSFNTVLHPLTRCNRVSSEAIATNDVNESLSQ